MPQILRSKKRLITLILQEMEKFCKENCEIYGKFENIKVWSKRKREKIESFLERV